MITAAEAQLAEQLLAQGLAYWSAFQQRKAGGLLTAADLDAAAAKLDGDLVQLEADIKAQSDAEIRSGGG